MALQFGSQFVWWYLSAKQKKILEEQRKAGKFGGETAKGVGLAPYYWPQEHGEPKASIEAQHVVEEAVEGWRVEANAIVADFVRIR